CDIVFTYAMVVAAIVGQVWLSATLGPAWGWLVVPLTSVWIGFWMLALTGFTHEAAHFNIHPRQRTNDQLANWFICGWIAQDIAHYRKVHWSHHLHLGSPEDTEVSYHNAPTPGFLLQTLCGIHLLRVFLRYRRVERVEAKQPRSWAAPLRGVA